jgi:hypothetical protein
LSFEGLPGTEDPGGINEDYQYVRVGHPDRSAVAERKSNYTYLIEFQDTRILSTVPGYVDRLTREAVELEFHPNNTNGVMETSLSPP